MKNSFVKRILAMAVGAAMLFSAVPGSIVSAANTQDQPDLQLQTILIDNNGADWTTESWGGATMTPNTNWTTLTIRDYYENGCLDFEVRSNGTGSSTFRIGLVSKRHGKTVQICWTDMAAYQDISAGTDWSEYSLPIKELVDAYPDSGFSLDNFWYVYVGGVPSGTTLSFRNMTISSTDDERQYSIIKVDQVGYPCNGAKTARISYFEKFGSLEGKIYEIVNADTDAVVASGTLSAAKKDAAFSGECVHVVNFDEVTAPGTYYIRIPNAGLDASARSPRDVEEGLDMDTITSVAFRIQDDVYDGLLSDLTKYFYYQRQGIDLKPEYAGEFARENLHPNDISVKKWSDRNNPGAETYDVSGGWYDAGDYGKYVSPAAATVEDLLLAYELFPDAFADMDLEIPETDPDNSRYVDAPGILSEIKWELDMLLKMEHSSKDGSFYAAANYRDGVIYLEDTLYQTSTYQSDDSETDLRSHLATAGAAAVFAHAYIVYKDIPAYTEFAEECLATALRAWDWVTDSSNAMHMSISAANRTYTFTQEELNRDMFWAAGALYRALTLSGVDASAFENYLIENCNAAENTNCFNSSMSLSYNHAGESFLGFFHYLYGNNQANEEIAKVFSKFSTWRANMLRNNTWGTTFPEWGCWWGSNKQVAQNAMTLLLGSIILEGQDLLPENTVTAAENAFHYLLGENPISFSYVSGNGENCVENIYSGIYSNDARLDPYQIPAGYFTEGSDYYDNRHLSKFNGKCYLDSDGEYTTNENTIYGNAAMILLTAAIISQNASHPVTGDVNADGVFNISDIVMMQKWLLAVPNATLTDWRAGDLYSDHIINAFDLCFMRKLLIEQ
ncbi:glycoside hydrolase family 9 protein [uncultured Ruminococcus sp.]|uniref:glycoside hydrolase family 9 protein n=1 Tax=uncultured Ruminococcus sp. TaxID=165186 RepID=UPI0026354B07|nr:glycoside hydrolase family 9 protein [uncultured Ruminococcus sp.]